MVLHPHAIGWPNRLQVLEQFLDHARGLPDLWNATSAAVRPALAAPPSPPPRT